MVELIVISFFVLMGVIAWGTKQTYYAGYNKGYARGDIDATARRVDIELRQAAEERLRDSAIDNPPPSR